MSFESMIAPGKKDKRNLEVPPKGALFYKGTLPNRPDIDERDDDAPYERREAVSEYDGTEDPMEILMRKQEGGTTEEEIEALRDSVSGDVDNQRSRLLVDTPNSDTQPVQTGGERSIGKKFMNGTERVEASIKEHRKDQDSKPFRGQEPRYKNVRRKGEAWK